MSNAIARRADWQSRLGDYLVAVARQPFKYGELDCGLFVAGAIEAMCGVDVAAELRGYALRCKRLESPAIRIELERIQDPIHGCWSITLNPEVIRNRRRFGILPSRRPLGQNSYLCQAIVGLWLAHLQFS